MFTRNVATIIRAFLNAQRVYLFDKPNETDDVWELAKGQTVVQLKAEICKFYEEPSWSKDWQLKPLTFDKFLQKYTRRCLRDFQLRDIAVSFDNKIWHGHCPRTHIVHNFTSKKKAEKLQWCKCCPLEPETE